MLSRRSILRNAVALLPFPILHRNRSLSVCPASEIQVTKDNHEHTVSNRRQLTGFSIDISYPTFTMERGVLTLQELDEPEITISISFINRKDKETTIKFENVKELKIYWTGNNCEINYIHCSSILTNEFERKQYNIPCCSAYFDINILKIYVGDRLLIAAIL